MFPAGAGSKRTSILANRVSVPARPAMSALMRQRRDGGIEVTLTDGVITGDTAVGRDVSLVLLRRVMTVLRG